MTGFPEVAVAERSMLEQFLDFHRAGVVRTLDGVTDEEAADRVLPATDLTVGGIVKHLAAMEDLWFSHKLLDAPSAEPWLSAPFGQDPDWEFHSAADNSVTELRDLYLSACDASRGIVARLESLDVQAARASFGDKLVSLRWIYLHMIEETAQHRGHLDLLLDAIRQKKSRTVGQAAVRQ
ncbi:MULTISPECIES: DinB family protein [unclassified Kribbella]|uniref:DinB family protein n=1 Tax=unclassified Kribbella TaxID=2644121 RepID=UPI003076A339